jgi:hypothetical protein
VFQLESAVPTLPHLDNSRGLQVCNSRPALFFVNWALYSGRARFRDTRENRQDVGYLYMQADLHVTRS